MGLELHITRAEVWSESTLSPITSDEWLEYIASDSELEATPEYGRYRVRWLGHSKYDDPWLTWDSGRIYTKWPDTALYQKMFQIATSLGAHIQDDEGAKYLTIDAWEFDPELWRDHDPHPAPRRQPLRVDWGIFTLPVIVAAYVLVNWIVDSVLWAGYFSATAWPKLLAGLGSASTLWVLGSHLNRNEEEKDRRQRFLGLQMEYWAPVALLLSVLLVAYKG